MKKTILIAGGTDGIGFSFLKHSLASSEYAKCYVLGRNFNKVDGLGDTRVVPLVCDITKSESIHAAMKKISEPLDAFVNTIGTFQKKSVMELTEEDIRNHFEVNSIGNITLTTNVLAKLNKTFSQILVCLATLAVEPRESYSIQSATKASHRYFLESLRLELETHIRVMMIHPSSVQTAIFDKAGDTRSTSKYPKPEVIAEMMAFMLNQPKTVEIPELIVKNR